MGGHDEPRTADARREAPPAEGASSLGIPAPPPGRSPGADDEAGPAGSTASSSSERYVERAPLGEGATGTVVRAFDQVRRHEVALKVLHVVDPDALYRFKGEFRSLAGLVHPNIVTLYELFVSGGRWVVAMELVEQARPFLDFVRPYQHWLRRPSGIASGSERRSSFPSGSSSSGDAGGAPGSAPTPEGAQTAFARTVELGAGAPGEPQSAEAAHVPSRRMAIITAQLDFDRLRGSMLQLIDGLEVMHRGGLLHRDLKPSNVLVDRDGRVVICDFGLVTLARSRPRGLAGTPAYMSPEQAVDGPLSAASDLYSVGVMLYEALTGQLPATGSSTESLIANKRGGAIVPPRVLDPEIPIEMEQLCLGLLDPSPAGRPGLQEVRAVLKGLPATSSLGAIEEPAGSRFVGRERERAALRRALADARQGQTVAVLITGPSGSGKSALMAAWCEQARARHEALVFGGRCYQNESLPFKAVDAVVDAIAGHLMALPTEAAAALLPGDAEIRALTEMFPVLRRATAVTQAIGRHATPTPEHRRMPLAQSALGSLALALARERPVVIAIDDLQWGDLDSEPLLRELIQRPGSPGILVLATLRREPDSTSQPEGSPDLLTALSRPALDGLSGHRDFRRVELEPLVAADATQLVAAIMGDEPVPADVLEQLIADAGGHPMFVIELAHALRRGESLVDLDGLDDLIDRRIDALPHDGRRLVEAVATSARPQPLALLSRALDLDREALTLAELLAARMIRVVSGSGGERLTTYHDRVREVALGRLSPSQRTRLHRRLARAFESAPELDFEALALHWAGAEDPRRASVYARKAGDRALANQAYRRAAEHYAQTLKWASLEAQARDEVELKLARAMNLAGSQREAAGLYQRLAARRPPEQAARLYGLALVCLLRVREIGEAKPLIHRVGRDMGVKVPVSKIAMLGSLLWGRLALAVRKPRIRDLKGPDALGAKEASRLEMTHQIITSLAPVDTVAAFTLHTRYIRDGLRLGDPTHIAHAMGSEAVFLAILQGHRKREEISALIEQAVTAAAASRREPVMTHIRAQRGVCDYFSLVRLRDTVCTMDTTAEHLAAVPELQWFHDELVRYCSDARGLAGSFAEQAQKLPELLERVRKTGNEALRENLSRYTGMWLYLALDRPEQGQELMDRAKPPEARRLTIDILTHEITRSTFELYCERLDAAFERTSRLWGLVRGNPNANIPMFNCMIAGTMGQLRVLRAGRRGHDRRRELAEARKMAAHLERQARSVTHYASGRAALLDAMIAAAEGERESVGERLRAAIRSFDECQADTHGMPARRALGRLVGGDEGLALGRVADAWGEAEGIVDPERFARWQCPVTELLASSR